MQKKGMYMQNEFEKQVQQKMEELKLVPSDPVWEKVEMQIRKKKDRRALIFWIPVLALVGAGLWLGIDNYPGQTAYTKNTPETPKQSSVNVPVTESKTIQDGTQSTVKPNSSFNGTAGNKSISTNALSYTAKKSSQKTSTERTVSDRGKKASYAATGKVVAGVITVPRPQETERKASNINTNPGKAETINNAAQTEKPVDKTVEPAKHDSAAISTPAFKKQASKKWKYNLAVVMGASGLGRMGFYNGQKSANVFYGPPTGASTGGNTQYSTSAPSEVEKGLAFAIGAIAKKQLSKRTFFSTGLQYNYYSNTIHVGNQVNLGGILLSNSRLQYYLGQGSLPYKDKYHFVSIPADLDWQILRKRPLNLNLGLSFQYLVGSNALVYHSSSQLYFHDMASFNRAQLFSALGITYSVPLKQRPLSFGPQVQYGFTKIEKDNADHHLFSYGIKAQWQLKK
jgi:hypothetical protein